MFRSFSNGSRGPTLLATAGGEAELVRGCMTTNRKAKELTESLGLCNTNTGSAKLKFNDPDVIELNKEVQAAVDSFLHPPNRASADLKEALSRRETFEQEVEDISHSYGQRIWGKTKRTHLLVAGTKPLYPKDLFWDSKEDQRTIRIYLRCWMVKRAARSIGDRERRSRNAQRIHPPSNGDKPKTPTGRKSFDFSERESSSEDGEIIEYIPSPSRTENPSFVSIGPKLASVPSVSDIPTTFRTRMAEGFYRSAPTSAIPAPIARMYSTPPASQMLLPPIQIPDARQPSPLFEPETSAPPVGTVGAVQAVDAGEGGRRAENNDDLYEDPSPRERPRSLSVPISPPGPNKRKRIESSQSSQEPPPTQGKLPKVKPTWERSLIAEMPKQKRLIDPYDVPQSPSQTASTADPFPRRRFGRRLRDGSTESDPTYIPSRASSRETDDYIEHLISEELGPSLASSQIDETASQQVHVPATQEVPARGGSDTMMPDYADCILKEPQPQRNDQCIATYDTQDLTEEEEEDEDAPLLPTKSDEFRPPRPCSATASFRAPTTPSTPINVATTTSSNIPPVTTDAITSFPSFTIKTPPSPPPLTTHQQTLLRNELFILLLSFLNSLNQFAPSSPIYLATEDRLNHLLYHFVDIDTPTLLSTQADYFPGLFNAFTTWMALRTRLRIFQTKTQYFGPPGEEWRAWLRAREDTGERARACIALAEMCEGGLGVMRTMGGNSGAMDSNGITEVEREMLNSRLKDLFDLLTMFPACNGAEEFGGISNWNERLWIWFR